MSDAIGLHCPDCAELTSGTCPRHARGSNSDGGATSKPISAAGLLKTAAELRREYGPAIDRNAGLAGVVLIPVAIEDLSRLLDDAEEIERGDADADALDTALDTIADGLLCDGGDKENCEELGLHDDEVCNPCIHRRIALRALGQQAGPIDPLPTADEVCPPCPTN